MKRTYIESVKKYYVKILSEAVKKKSVSVSEFETSIQFLQPVSIINTQPGIAKHNKILPEPRIVS